MRRWATSVLAKFFQVAKLTSNSVIPPGGIPFLGSDLYATLACLEPTTEIIFHSQVATLRPVPLTQILGSATSLQKLSAAERQLALS